MPQDDASAHQRDGAARAYPSGPQSAYPSGPPSGSGAASGGEGTGHGPLPERIGPYRIEEEIGRGGTGVVYRAWDERLDRAVALKALADELASEPERLSRFEREAKLLASLNHPHVATIHDLCRLEGRPVLVLELLEGPTLADALGSGALAVDEAQRIGLQIASALEAAHGRGIIHRDLKPANIKFGARGALKVLDFGLAHSLDAEDESPVERDCAVVGTAGYMSPEQVRGREPGTAADLWAFGCVLLECLTGLPAFGGDTWQEKAAAILNDAPDWSRLPASTPQTVVRLLQHCLERSPEARLGDAAQARQVLEEALAERGWMDSGAGTALRPFLRATREPLVKTVLQHELEDPEGLLGWLSASRTDELRARLVRLARDLAAWFGAREIEGGDRFLLLFERPLDAVAYSLEYHGAIAELAEEFEIPLGARIGVHLGEVSLRENPAADLSRGERRLELDGMAKPMAARLMALAMPGQTLLSRAAQELAQRSALEASDFPESAEWAAHGRYRFEGLEEPVEVLEVGLHGVAPLTPPPGTSHAQRHRPGNLPQQLTSFVGREAQLEELETLLRTSRLVTLTGAGGCGKTRLSLAAADRLQDGFQDGAWFIDLASLSDELLVPEAVATALGLTEEPGVELTRTLVDSLRDRHALLVVDNCEHLLEACARLAAVALAECPGLIVLASSREALGVPGEVTYIVPSLGVPDPDRLPPLEQLARLESVRLFVDRVAAVRRGFKLDEKTAPHVALACSRLDGIPLAIELAAARVKMLSVKQVAQRLDDCFRLLTGGGRGALPRHQTLRATIDWSHDQLREPERVLFRRLAVFAGGFDLEAAERVGADPDDAVTGSEGEGGARLEGQDVLDTLSLLVDKSLVQVEERAAGPRYQLLQVVRQYAGEKLDEAGGRAQSSERHRSWFLELAERAEPELSGPDQAEWLALLDADHQNIQAAIAAFERDPQGAQETLRLSAATWRFWRIRGHWDAGRLHLEKALARAGDEAHPGLCARALAGAGALAFQQGDVERARIHLSRSLALRRELDDRPGIADSLDRLGEMARRTGDLDDARALHEESLQLRRALGDEPGIAASLDHLGTVFFAQGELSEARALHEEGLAHRRRLGDLDGIAGSLNNLGAVACARGDVEGALAFYEESQELRGELGDHAGLAATLNSLAEVARTAGDLASARSLAEQGLALRRELGDRRGIAESLTNLGLAYKSLGQFDLSRTLQEESLELLRELQDRPGMAASLHALGCVAQDAGDFAEAQELLLQALRLSRRIGDKAGVSAALERLGWVAAALERPRRAICLLAAAEALRETLGSAVVPEDGVDLAVALSAARTVLGATEADRARAEGRALDLDAAVRFALSE